MTLTIAVNDTLADQLRKQAATQHLSPEEFALRLLGEAVEQIEAAQKWEEHDQRRVALIRKSAATPLTAEEEQELEALQWALDQRLEPVDDELLTTLDRLRHAVDALPPGASP